MDRAGEIRAGVQFPAEKQIVLEFERYRFILGHYYRGTSLGTLSKPRIVRVLLSTSSGDVGFSGATSACRTSLDPKRSYEAHLSGGTVVLRSSGGKRLARCGGLLRAAGNGTISIAGLGRYRGALETVPEGSSLNVVNALTVEQYVKGVIPNESPPSWPMAELKAQAVISRSFALTAGRDGNGFDLYSDTRSQVYKGLESEYASTNEAADATRGQDRPGAARDSLCNGLRLVQRASYAEGCVLCSGFRQPYRERPGECRDQGRHAEEHKHAHRSVDLIRHQTDSGGYRQTNDKHGCVAECEHKTLHFCFS